jgi:hypothetical protein
MMNDEEVKMANTKRVEKGIPITVWLDEGTVTLIDELAGKADMSRSRLVRNLIKVGVDDFKMMDSMGLITVLRKVEAAKEGIRGIIERVLAKETG